MAPSTDHPNHSHSHKAREGTLPPKVTQLSDETGTGASGSCQLLGGLLLAQELGVCMVMRVMSLPLPGLSSLDAPGEHPGLPWEP